jgi:DNA mismatch repair protein MutS
LDVKAQYGDCILFFRLGDFYEMFYDDANLASKELDITLTGKDCGQGERAPMCGVPYHALDSYLPRLVSKGYKVAICEQLEDPSAAKGIVERGVIRVVTPGTVTEPAMLDDKSNAYLMSVYREGRAAGLAVTDLTTGVLYATSILWGNVGAKLIDEISKYMPKEIIASGGFLGDEAFRRLFKSKFSMYTSTMPDDYFDAGAARRLIGAHFSREGGSGGISDGGMAANPQSDGCGGAAAVLGDSFALLAVGALLRYLEETQKRGFEHLSRIIPYAIDEYMIIDASSRRNLELTETIKNRTRAGSLIGAVDRTLTSPGGRLLKSWFSQPLVDISAIRARHGAVRELKDKYILRSRLRDCLKSVHDIERLISRIVLGSANCRDFLALRNSLSQIPGIKAQLGGAQAPLLKATDRKIDSLGDVAELIGSAISEDAPISTHEGNIIKDGYNSEVDALRSASRDGKSWLAALEKSERERTGVKNLKVGYNKVFGYYFEVTKLYAHLTPPEYVRRQTLANCERYISDGLKKLEDEILGAEEKLAALERRLFDDVRDRTAAQVRRIKQSAEGISELDVLAAFAETADRENYCMPEMNTDGVIDIKDGRHPVVEQALGQGAFVPNDAYLDTGGNRTAIITGPNMAGKSTYMRQTALIALMAQAGCFVPASRASICVTDRIFTRVGAADDLAAGQSTFMVEMSEVANILANATAASLIILDEIGRGTSTFDGLSIAWAVVEFLNDQDKIGAKTLFSTHYHELTELSGKMPGINNYCVTIAENGEDITFLHKIKKGGADGSYGVHVAKLAGLPAAVTDRAGELLAELEDADISKRAARQRRAQKPVDGQINFLLLADIPKREKEVVDSIRDADISKLTPIDAMNYIYALQQKLKLG